MSSNFFSNNVIYVDGENIERVDYVVDLPQSIFNAPNHTVGTENLLVYLNNGLCIRDNQYEDYNSSQIRFKEILAEGSNVSIILIKGNSDFEWGYF